MLSNAAAFGISTVSGNAQSKRQYNKLESALLWWDGEFMGGGTITAKFRGKFASLRNSLRIAAGHFPSDPTGDTLHIKRFRKRSLVTFTAAPVIPDYHILLMP